MRTRKPRDSQPIEPRPIEGQITPHNLHAETSVISAALLVPERIAGIDWLLPDHFYSGHHQKIWAAISYLRLEQTPLDIVTVVNRLRLTNDLQTIGGIDYLTNILDACPAPSHLETHANILRELSRKRKLIATYQVLEAQARLDPESFARLASTALGNIEALSSDVSGFIIEGADAICKPLEPLRYLIPGLKIGPGRATLFAGDSYTGKTLACAEIELAVATGAFKIWSKWDVDQTGRVLHMNFDSGGRTWIERIQRIMRSRGIDQSAIQGRLDVCHHPGVFLDDEGAEQLYLQAVRGYTLCVIDSLIGCVRDTEEKSEEMGRVIYKLMRISEKTGCTFILIHHTTKPAQQQQGKGYAVKEARDSVRGSRSIIGACDGVFVLVSGGKSKPVRLVHDKEPTGGHTIEDQWLKFCDEETPIDVSLDHTDPNWGLYVETVDKKVIEAEKKATERAHADPQAGFEQFCKRLLELVKRYPGESGTELRERCEKVSKDRFYAGVAALERRGDIVFEAGPRKARLWRAATRDSGTHCVIEDPQSILGATP